MDNQQATVKLNITLALGGSEAEVIVGMYELNIIDDLNQTTWNLCECDDQRQAEKFGSPSLVSYELKPASNGDKLLEVVFKINSSDLAFVEQAVEEYMDGFSDWMRSVQNGYYSRTGMRVGTDVEVVEWEVAVEQ